jgi:hypothetical protein
VAATLRFRPGFVDVERPPSDIPAVQCSDRTVPVGRVCHLDKRKTPCLACVPIGDQVDSLHAPIRFKQRTDGRLRGAEVQISYKDVFHIVTRVFQSCGPDEADLDSAALLRDSFKCTTLAPAQAERASTHVSVLRHTCGQHQLISSKGARGGFKVPDIFLKRSAREDETRKELR